MNVALAGAALALTPLAYSASLQLRARHAAPYTTPVLTSVLFVIVVLAATHLPYTAYAAAQQPLTSLLLPACSALGVTCFKRRAILAEHARTIVLSIGAGTIVASASAVVFARLVALPQQLVGIEAIKSVTAPVAIQLAPYAHADPALAVALVVFTGVAGAALGPAALTFARVRHPLARGVALGCVSHGIGTAQAATEDEVAGAAGSVAMCVVAVVVALVGAPLLGMLGR